MNRLKLVCRNAQHEVVWTIESYETEADAKELLKVLNTTPGPAENTWCLEPLRYN